MNECPTIQRVLDLIERLTVTDAYSLKTWDEDLSEIDSDLESLSTEK